MEDQDFIGRPDRYACAKTADEIVDVLRLEHENFRLTVGGPKTVVFEPAALSALRIQPQFERAVDRKHDRHVADPD